MGLRHLGCVLLGKVMFHQVRSCRQHKLERTVSFDGEAGMATFLECAADGCGEVGVVIVGLVRKCMRRLKSDEVWTRFGTWRYE